MLKKYFMEENGVEEAWKLYYGKIKMNVTFDKHIIKDLTIF